MTTRTTRPKTTRARPTPSPAPPEPLPPDPTPPDPWARFRALARERVEAAGVVDAALDAMVTAVVRYMALSVEVSNAGQEVGLEPHVLVADRIIEPAIRAALADTGLLAFGLRQPNQLTAREADELFFLTRVGDEGSTS